MANQNTNPVTEAELQRIRELHAEGKGRNQISRLTGRSCEPAEGDPDPGPPAPLAAGLDPTRRQYP
ncbi:hypothetical protein [Streptomyces sp. XY006]|uniref:hypothetical protein n=1 Tax=Streptomyces sp. XY006 TaxID=2021410 RepID=UPI00117C7F53|nr:hypothetical protein [Streptomyces sp. XY006]